MQNLVKSTLFVCFSLAYSATALSAPPAGKGGGGGGNTGGGGGVHITASPSDYVLSSDVTLSDGSVLPAGTQWYQTPDVEQLRAELARGSYNGDVDWANKVVFGYDIMNKTYAMVGDIRTDGEAPLYQGEVMNCSTCHAQGGTVPYAYPLFRTSNFFGVRDVVNDPENTADVGKLYGNLGYMRDTVTRIRDCGVHCAGGGEIPEDSAEMAALVAWTDVVRDGIYPGEGLIEGFKNPASEADLKKIPGARIPPFSEVLTDPTLTADPVVGAQLYATSCASCHGKDGSGKWNSRKGYSAPPLSGPASYTKAGGPYMVPVVASFIQQQMPLSSPGSLTKQEALDIAAYVSSMDRASRWWQDYFFEHNPCGRPAFLPLDVGVTPAGYPFTAEQAKFGPWAEINTWLKGGACAAVAGNEALEPLLERGFDNGFDGVNNFVKPVLTPALRR